jgi:hypothetical protein
MAQSTVLSYQQRKCSTIQVFNERQAPQIKESKEGHQMTEIKMQGGMTYAPD